VPFLLVGRTWPHFTLVTLNRPERMNAMSFVVMIPFRQALEEISRDNDTAWSRSAAPDPAFAPGRLGGCRPRHMGRSG
jgi:enoyl-CoA hydratase/carnithine racemase